MLKTPTITVSHAVEEEPGRIGAAVLDEGHIVTGFDAEHSKQLHPLAGKRALTSRTVLELLGDGQFAVSMGFPLRVKVNLNQYKQIKILNLSLRFVYKNKENKYIFNIAYIL